LRLLLAQALHRTLRPTADHAEGLVRVKVRARARARVRVSLTAADHAEGLVG